jgi:hypothetical protein
MWQSLLKCARVRRLETRVRSDPPDALRIEEGGCWLPLSEGTFFMSRGFHSKPNAPLGFQGVRKLGKDRTNGEIRINTGLNQTQVVCVLILQFANLSAVSGWT